jgi:hypothetical protein
MIHIAADKIIASKRAHVGVPLALAGATFALPEAATPDLSESPLAVRHGDAATGNAVPPPDTSLLALFPETAPAPDAAGPLTLAASSAPPSVEVEPQSFAPTAKLPVANVVPVSSEARPLAADQPLPGSSQASTHPAPLPGRRSSDVTKTALLASPARIPAAPIASDGPAVDLPSAATATAVTPGDPAPVMLISEPVVDSPGRNVDGTTPAQALPATRPAFPVEVGTATTLATGKPNGRMYPSASLRQVADPVPSLPLAGTAPSRQLEAQIHLFVQIAPSPLAVSADVLPLPPGTNPMFVSGSTAPAPAAKLPTPLHFAISAGLAATISDMQKAGSPLMPPIAAASPVVLEPTPMPAHWQVAPNVSVASAPPAIVAAAMVGTPLAAAALSPRRFDQRVEQAVTTSAGGIATLLAPAALAPVAEAPGIDLSGEGWPTDMMAHIEQLRDAADATDTRIRLAPDMLGSVDIDVRQDGDTLHVRFIAEQAQTRTLLQEAQPRLAEAAEARGLKLGGSSVDLGAQGQHRQPAAQPAVASRHTPSTTVASGQEPADDARIA